MGKKNTPIISPRILPVFSHSRPISIHDSVIFVNDHAVAGIRVNCILPGVFETPMTVPWFISRGSGGEFANVICHMSQV